MARPKLEDVDRTYRIALQSALFRAVRARGIKQMMVEIELNITNKKEDGAVWRKIGRGAQLVGLDSLCEMIEKAEKLRWCVASDIYDDAEKLVDIRDSQVIEAEIVKMKDTIENIAIFCRLGSIDAQDQIIQSLKDAIKIIES